MGERCSLVGCLPLLLRNPGPWRKAGAAHSGAPTSICSLENASTDMSTGQQEEGGSTAEVPSSQGVTSSHPVGSFFLLPFQSLTLDGRGKG